MPRERSTPWEKDLQTVEKEEENGEINGCWP